MSALPKEQVERLRELTKGHVDYKWELIDGIVYLLMPGVPEHSDTNFLIQFAIAKKLKGSGCKIYTENMKFHLTEKDRFIPDIAVVCKPFVYNKGAADVIPDLVVETLSPRTANYDKLYKLGIYGRSGVKEYWIVDIKNFSVEVFENQGGEMKLHGEYRIYPQYEIDEAKEEGRLLSPTNFTSLTFPELEICLHEIFEYVLPEDY